LGYRYFPKSKSNYAKLIKMYYHEKVSGKSTPIDTFPILVVDGIATR